MNRYWLNTITGQVIDAKWQFLCDFRAKTKNWPKVIVPISEKVYYKILGRGVIQNGKINLIMDNSISISS